MLKYYILPFFIVIVIFLGNIYLSTTTKIRKYTQLKFFMVIFLTYSKISNEEMMRLKWSDK